MYERGIVAFGKAGAVRAVLIMGLAGVYPRLLKYVAASKILGVACLSYAVIMLGLANTRSLFWGEFAVASFALPLAYMHTVPAAIMLEKSTKQNRGM